MRSVIQMDNIIIQRRLTHYRVPFYNKLNESVDFTLFVRENTVKVADINFSLKKITGLFPFKKRKSLGILFFERIIFKYKPEQVVVEFDLNILNIWVLLLLRKFFHFSLVLWTHGYSSKTHFFDPQKKFVDRVRNYWYKKADKIFVYEKKAYELLVPYVLKNKITILNNSVDTSQLVFLKEKNKNIYQSDLKKALGIQEKFVITFLGSLAARKHPTELVNIFKAIKREIDSVALLYIGDGSERQKIVDSISMNNVSNVYMLGAINDTKILINYLCISNLIAIPGHIGLVANTAIAMGIPLFTIKLGKYVKSHAPEFNYLIHKENAFIATDEVSFTQSIVDYLQGNLNFNKKNQNLDLSLDNMVRNFEEGLRKNNE